MEIPFPPAIADLIRAIDAAPRRLPPAEAVAEASKMLEAYNNLPAEAKASYLDRLRREKATVQAEIVALKDRHIADHKRNPTAQSAHMAGELCVQAGDPESADAFFEEAADLAPDLPSQARACFHRGQAKLICAGGRTGIKPEEVAHANRLFEKALRLHPTTAGAEMSVAQRIVAKRAPRGGDEFNTAGLEHLLTENFDAALEACEDAVDVDPDNPEYRNNLSLACNYLGRFGRAAKLSMRALEIDPEQFTNNLVVATAGMRATIEASE